MPDDIIEDGDKIYEYDNIYKQGHEINYRRGYNTRNAE